ncbi:hypothetical protein [Burkholderia sp. MSMB1589WGS]|uniref:hypothetical protein n=1 Tax=Burkholderia sp. MSMB1589WGS TaxID=1636425 RepID=UPI0012E932A1|nr:hypothetical protein [Burkholderia sp. MSMB1589WGS]
MHETVESADAADSVDSPHARPARQPSPTRPGLPVDSTVATMPVFSAWKQAREIPRHAIFLFKKPFRFVEFKQTTPFIDMENTA